MKKIWWLLLLVLLLMAAFPSSAQQVLFEKKFTGIDILPPGFVHYNAYARQVCELSDGNILIMGWGYDIDTTGVNASEIYHDLKKLDPQGNIIWTQYIRPDTILSNNVWINMTSFIVLDNGNILLSGEKEGSTMGAEVTHLILLDPDGNRLFDTTYANGNSNYIYTLPQASAKTPNGVVLAGYAFGPTTDYYGYVIRIDSSFHKEWEFWFSRPYYSYFRFQTVIATQDGNIDCFGRITSDSLNKDLFLFVRLNASGQMLFFKTYADSLSSLNFADAAAGNGYRLMVGNFYDPPCYRIILKKIDESGNLVWTKKYADTSRSGIYPYSLAITADEQFLITGEIRYHHPVLEEWQSTDIYLMKTDADGNKLWEEAYGTDLISDSSFWANWEIGMDVVAAMDGSYLIAGCNNINATYGPVINLLKIGEGYAGSGGGKETPAGLVFYPNPATDKIIIEIPGTAIGSRLSIMATDGRELIRQTIADRKTVIGIGNLPAGVYIVRLTNEKTVTVGKMIRQ